MSFEGPFRRWRTHSSKDADHELRKPESDCMVFLLPVPQCLLPVSRRCSVCLANQRIKQSYSVSPQIVHMGWTCECPEGSVAGKTSVFKFLALRGPYFSIFRSPPVIISSFGFPLYYTPLFSAPVISNRSSCSDESLSH